MKCAAGHREQHRGLARSLDELPLMSETDATPHPTARDSPSEVAKDYTFAPILSRQASALSSGGVCISIVGGKFVWVGFGEEAYPFSGPPEPRAPKPSRGRKAADKPCPPNLPI